MSVQSKASSFLFRPINEHQREAQRLFATNDILFLLGPAGSGKTHCAVGLATQHILSHPGSKLYLSRPAVHAGGEDHGFLKGRLDEKMAPWLAPIHDVLGNLTFQKPADFFKEHVEIVPLGFIRGRTLDRGVAVLDEAQNASYGLLKAFLTRLGSRGKLILCGDPSQSDLPFSQFGLTEVAGRLGATPGVSVCHLPASPDTRHPLIPEILRLLP